MCWIVSDYFPHLLDSSSVSGSFKIYFLQFLVSMTWSCIALKKPFVSANKPECACHLFDAFIIIITILLQTESLPFKATVFVLRVGIFSPHPAATVSRLCIEICNASSESDTVTWSSSIKSVLMPFVF